MTDKSVATTLFPRRYCTWHVNELHTGTVLSSPFSRWLEAADIRVSESIYCHVVIKGLSQLDRHQPSSPPCHTRRCIQLCVTGLYTKFNIRHYSAHSQGGDIVYAIAVILYTDQTTKPFPHPPIIHLPTIIKDNCNHQVCTISHFA